jgi:hypothetical protein
MKKAKTDRRDFVQARNPRSGLWVRIDRETGEICRKRTKGKFKGVPLARLRPTDAG